MAFTETVFFRTCPQFPPVYLRPSTTNATSHSVTANPQQDITTQASERARARETERAMAEEIQTGICDGGNWWSTPRTGVFDGPVMSTSVSCSTEFMTWTAAAGMGEAKSRSSDESQGSLSSSSITFQDTHKPQAPDQLAADPIVDSTLQVSDFGLSSPSISWNQPFL